ncbi:unnamed protein product [Cyprideis torosa]|uniref:Uncharacterized protein n=1 Tax=Cyprideis torosa TaxID=163714 RepID=A0A7R8WD88_9CRUS|nr:unnamed protein product [Cyprideis torosa]CAG0888130.1 unnamed protein product [Cyprideis torosa]
MVHLASSTFGSSNMIQHCLSRENLEHEPRHELMAVEDTLGPTSWQSINIFYGMLMGFLLLFLLISVFGTLCHGGGLAKDLVTDRLKSGKDQKSPIDLHEVVFQNDKARQSKNMLHSGISLDSAYESPTGISNESKQSLGGGSSDSLQAGWCHRTLFPIRETARENEVEDDGDSILLQKSLGTHQLLPAEKARFRGGEDLPDEVKPPPEDKKAPENETMWNYYFKCQAEGDSSDCGCENCVEVCLFDRRNQMKELRTLPLVVKPSAINIQHAAFAQTVPNYGSCIQKPEATVTTVASTESTVVFTGNSESSSTSPSNKTGTDSNKTGADSNKTGTDSNKTGADSNKTGADLELAQQTVESDDWTQEGETDLTKSIDEPAKNTAEIPEVKECDLKVDSEEKLQNERPSSKEEQNMEIVRRCPGAIDIPNAADVKNEIIHDGELHDVHDGKLNDLHDDKLHDVHDGKLYDVHDGKLNDLHDGELHDFHVLDDLAAYCELESVMSSIDFALDASFESTDLEDVQMPPCPPGEDLEDLYMSEGEMKDTSEETEEEDVEEKSKTVSASSPKEYFRLADWDQLEKGLTKEELDTSSLKGIADSPLGSERTVSRMLEQFDDICDEEPLNPTTSESLEFAHSTATTTLEILDQSSDRTCISPESPRQSRSFSDLPPKTEFRSRILFFEDRLKPVRKTKSLIPVLRKSRNSSS